MLFGDQQYMVGATGLLSRKAKVIIFINLHHKDLMLGDLTENTVRQPKTSFVIILLKPELKQFYYPML